MNKVQRSLSAVTAVGALVAVSLTGAPEAGAATRRAVPNSAPSWVAKARKIGAAPGSGAADFKVYLAPKGGTAALKAAVADVSDPKSARYHHFLSAKRFHRRYDATAASVATVSAWLRKNHLEVTSVEAHHRYLAVHGSVSSVQQAFKVALAEYHHNGRTVRANAKPLTVPAAVAPLVSTVTGIDTTPHIVTPKTSPAEPPPAGFRNGRPCSLSYGQLTASRQADFKTPLPKFKGKTLPYAVCGYTGPQYRAAYEGDNPEGLSGKGVTVAITDAYASPTIRGDVSTYGSRHGDGGYAAGQYTEKLPATFTQQDQCDPSGWYGEQTLDVEAVHAMAPDAKIRYYASTSCFDNDFLDTLNRVVDENRASIVSNSWSDLEGNETSDSVAAYEGIFLQGALQGISFMFSSGDSGDELARTGLKQVDYPASDPYVTAAGGTADAIGADGTFTFQTGWGTKSWSLRKDGQGWTNLGFTSGAGGGTSALFNRPAYQNGVVPRRFGAGRAVPDVALDADPNTGMLIGQTQTFTDGVYYDEFRIGGTSLASPLYAGLTALLSQHSKSRLGFLNPTIYSQAKTGVFTDIKGSPKDAGNVRVNYTNGQDESKGLDYFVRTFDHDSSLVTVRGWDNVTGVGSPNPKWITSIPAS